MDVIRSFEAATSVIFDYIHHETSPLKRSLISKQLSDYVKTNPEEIPQLAEYATAQLKVNFLVEAAVHYVHIFSVLQDFDRKYIQVILKCLQFIDSKHRQYQFNYAVKKASKIVKAEEIAGASHLSAFALLKYIKVEDEALLKKIAEGFAEAFTKVTNLYDPSYIYAKAVSKKIPSNIYKDVVVSRFNRQILRSGAQFIPIVVRSLPKYDLATDDKSIAYFIINNIANAKPEDREKLLKNFKTAAAAFNQDSLTETLVTFINKTSGFDQRKALCTALQYVKLAAAQQATLEKVFKFIGDEKQAEIKIEAINALSSCADQAIDFLTGLPATADIFPVVVDVLLNTKSEKAIEFAHKNFSVAPMPAARLILRREQELTDDENGLLSQPSKFQTAKFEVLLRTGSIEPAVELFGIAAQLYYSTVFAIEPKFVFPFICGLIDNQSINDKLLLSFTEFVTKNKSKIEDRRLILVAPRLATSADSEMLVSYLSKRPGLAQPALEFIGLSKEQFALVSNAIREYSENPLSEEDQHLFLCTDPIDIEHSSAQTYKEMKDEIAHPTGKTNLPQLKKKFEKETQKTADKQKELREEIRVSKVIPVKSAIALLKSHFLRAPKITASLTSFTPKLLEMRKCSIFQADVDELFIAAFNRIDAYRATPKTILSIITNEDEELDNFMLKMLIPSKLTDVLLHVISHRLPEFLADKDLCEYMCDINAITPESNVEILLPHYLDHANVKDCVYKFAVSLAKDAEVTSIPECFQEILFPDEQIRRCAIECIANSKITAADFSPKLFCQVYVQAASNPVAVELIEKLEPQRPSDKEIMQSYAEIFNLPVKDEALLKDIGISFAILMADNVDVCVKYFIDLYLKNTEEVESFMIPQQEQIRSAIMYGFNELKPLTNDAISFVTTTALKDIVPAVRENSMALCNYYIDNFDANNKTSIYHKFFNILNLPPVSSVENNRLRLALIELCMKVVTSQPELGEELMQCLITYNIRSPDEDVRELCAKTISTLAKKNTQFIDDFFNNFSKSIEGVKGTERIMGLAYTYAALLNSQGISSLKSRNVFDYTDQLAKEKDSNLRMLCAYIFAGLSFMFKSMIEMSLPRILPVLLALYGDNNSDVRAAADKASQSIVRNLTKACGERVLPYALENVENDESWRIQHAAILLVSSVIKGGTKNVQKFIPNIVSSLSKAMKSANGTVKEAAKEALDLLKGLITNEAIVDLFPHLIGAISTASKLEIAIEKISHLNLTSLLDSASLSLIVPIVAYGCRSTNVNTKSAAIKIIGHLPTISVKGTLDPSKDELIEPLFACIADASPSVRALASSSLSSIIVALPTSAFEEVMNRLLNDMIKKTNFAERQGYAMSIASLIKTRGTEELNAQLLDFVEKARNEKEINVRECYVSLLGFLSHFFGAEDFQSSYEITIDAVLEACADSNDAIRTVGLRSASLIAKTFALTHPDLILNPYFQCALKENWRYRLCAVNFMKAFVLACTGTTEADDKGIRQIGELLDRLKETLKPEILYPTLMTLFIISNDPVTTVNTEAQQVWRQIIPNTGSFLRQDLGCLLDRITSFLSSEFPVVRMVGASAMAEGVRKTKTRFLNMSLDKIDELLKVEDVDVQHGALVAIHALDEQMSQEYKLRACMQLAPFLSSPYDFIRNEAIEAFVQMRTTLGDEGAKQVSSELVKFVYARAESPDDISALSGLLAILGQHSIAQLTYQMFKRPLDADRPRVAGKIVSAAGPALTPIIQNFCDRVISISAHPPCPEEGEVALGIAKKTVEALSAEHLTELTTRLVENMRSQMPQNRQASIIIGGYVLDREGTHYNDNVHHLIRAALYLFDDPLDDIMNAAVVAVKTAGNRISLDDIEPLVKNICTDFDSICAVTQVRAFEYPEAFDGLAPIIEKALSSSSDEAISRAAELLSIIVPQLKSPPSQIRKLLALIVRNFQLSDKLPILHQLLAGSRALFEKAASERQMLVNSLPTAYLRLFKMNDTKLHQATAEALCSFADRVSTPALVVRLFLQVLKLQGENASATLLSSVVKTVAKIKLSDAESNEIITLLEPHLKHTKLAMRELASQAISTALLSSSIEIMKTMLHKPEIVSTESPITMQNAVVIISELLKSSRKDVTELALPRAIEILPALEAEENSDLKLVFPRLVIAVMIANPAKIPDMLPFIINVIESADTQHQVIACQCLQRLAVLKPSLWKSVSNNILEVLLSAYRFGEPALQSAAAVALFYLFRLEEKTAKETEALAEEAGDVDQTMDDFAAIVTQVQQDRANQRHGKAV